MRGRGSAVRHIILSCIKYSMIEHLKRAGRVLKGAFSQAASERIIQFTQKFQELRGRLDSATGTQAVKLLGRILGKVEIIGQFKSIWLKHTLPRF